MKKLTAVILVVLLCLLSACSANEKVISPDKENQSVIFRFDEATDVGEKLPSGSYKAVYAADDALYYIANDWSLHRTAPDGSGDVLLSRGNSGTVFLMIYGAKLFYLNSANDLLALDLNENTYHMIEEIAPDTARCENGKIYYLTKEGEPVCYDPQTGEKTDEPYPITPTSPDGR